MAQRGRPRRIPLADTTAVSETIRGDALLCRLSRGLNVYGFACPKHGLRYYAIVQPGTALQTTHLRPAADDASIPEPGHMLCCDLCAGALGWFAPHVENRQLKVQASAYAELQEIADEERATRKQQAERKAE